MTTTFTPSGDKQLWRYELREWTIPVYATPGLIGEAKHWHVVPALPLNHGSRMWLEAIVEPLSIQKAEGAWVVPDDKFCAVKCEGVTPEFYVEHRKVDDGNGRIYEVQLKGSLRSEGVSDDFIEELYQRTRVADLKTLRILFHAICQEMPRWLLATGKPLDLGWVKLWAFPYRANWKQILLRKFESILTVFKTPSPQLDYDLNHLGFHRALRCTDLMAIKRQGGAMHYTMRWTVEADLQKPWWKYVDQHEDDIYASAGKRGYLQRASFLFNRLAIDSIWVFKRWVEQTTSACGTVCKHGLDGGEGLAPKLRPDGVLPQSPDHGAVRRTTASPDQGLFDVDGRELGVEEAPDLSEMPTVLVTQQKLRDPGGNGRG